MASVAAPVPVQHNPAFNMPHATDEWEQGEQDDALIQSLLTAAPEDDSLAPIFDPDRPLDLGEKADDAVDFEDFSDDELPDEVTAPAGPTLGGDGDDDVDMNGHGDNELDALFGEGDVAGDDDFDDLFAEHPSSDHAAPDGTNGANGIPQPGPFTQFPEIDGLQSPPHSRPSPEFQSADALISGIKTEPRYADVEVEEDEETREQRELFEQARREREEREQRLRRGGLSSDAPPPLPQSNAELLEAIWPNFDRQEVPRFGALFPGKRAFYLSKTPLKPPKTINPARPSLDPEVDQDRAFRITTAPASRKRTNEELNDGGVLFITEDDSAPETSDEEADLASLDGEELIGGVSVQDLSVLCQDWETLSMGGFSDDGMTTAVAIQVGDDPEHELFAVRPAKRSKDEFHREEVGKSFRALIRDDFPSFEDPEAATAKLARRVPLDMNDPKLLIDTNPTVAQKKTRDVGISIPNDASGVMASTMYKKFNFSNDQEYEQLKENHARRVRGTLGTISIDHSNPALNLQYPFYKIKLSTKEARSFHRPMMHFRPHDKCIFEKKLNYTKSKALKGQDTQTIFAKAKDLSLADNSTMLLLEYSEECPLILSNFGMGNRLVNYYRRKDEEDKERPKLDLGETQVLLPNDVSPFSRFGKVEPGTTIPTLHNSMFRAPVVKHSPKSTDFLVIRNQTSVHGSHYYLRNLENLHVVGQEFPSVEVPGVHSRRVTSVAKNRLRMLAFRLYNKNRAMKRPHPWVGNAEITEHFPGSDISQNRTKMREIMNYNKETTSWDPKADEELVGADYKVLRSQISPEDIALCDAMQVGHRQLMDSGHGKDENVDVDAGDGVTLDEKLAPWRASKNFLAACGDNGMIALHGEGDPTGRGEGFSFVKISMKGGFSAPGESVHAKISAEKKKAQTGHSYNVDDQKKAYASTIDRIWNAQMQSLSSTFEPGLDVDMGGVEDSNDAGPSAVARTPYSEAPTPAAMSRHGDDESASQYSKLSRAPAGRILKITRSKPDKYGKMVDTVEFVEEEAVARLYYKRQEEEELLNEASVSTRLDRFKYLLIINSLENFVPTGDQEKDRLKKKQCVKKLNSKTFDFQF
jgi:hypothetical protein